MLINLNQLTACQIEANDGTLGHVKDVYFDDKHWVVRFLKVDTHAWMPLSQKVLLSPISVLNVNHQQETIRVGMTKEMIKECPKPEAHQPVSREFEKKYFDYFGYQYYWAGASLWADYAQPSALIERDLVVQVREKTPPKKNEDNHLRSAQEIKHYDVIEVDAKKGQVIDFIFDSIDWSVKYLVLDTCSWLPTGKKVLITPGLIDKMRWSSGTVNCRLSFDELENCPEFVPDKLNDDNYINSVDKQLAA